MNKLHITSEEPSSTFFGSDFHIGAGCETDQLIRTAFSQFPQFRRENGIHVSQADILGDFVECWLIDNEPINSYAVYGQNHVIRTARHVVSNTLDDESGGDVSAVIGNHGTRILPKGVSYQETQAEQKSATEKMRAFMTEVLKGSGHTLDMFEGVKRTDDGVIRHHGDLEDVADLINDTIEIEPHELLDVIDGDTQHRLQEKWRTFNQRYIWPLLGVSPRLASAGFRVLQDTSKATSVLKEGLFHGRVIEERWKNPMTPWAMTQLRMMKTINEHSDNPHPNPLIVSGHTHTPLIVQHPKYKGTAVSLGGWDGEIYNPVVGIKRGERFLMAEFDPMTGERGRWNVRDDVKVA